MTVNDVFSISVHGSSPSALADQIETALATINPDTGYTYDTLVLTLPGYEPNNPVAVLAVNDGRMRTVAHRKVPGEERKYSPATMDRPVFYAESYDWQQLFSRLRAASAYGNDPLSGIRAFLDIVYKDKKGRGFAAILAAATESGGFRKFLEMLGLTLPKMCMPR